MRMLFSVLSLVAGALALAAGWAGTVAAAVLVASVLVPYLILVGGARLRVPRVVATVVALLPLAAIVMLSTLDGGGLAVLRDAVPRLLTAARPAPATPELLLPGVLFGGLAGAWAGARAAVAGRFAPVACAAALYVAGALLTAGRSDPHGALAALMVICGAAAWSTGTRGILIVTISAVAAVTASLTSVANAFEPRHYVAPPPLPLLERNPLPGIAALVEDGDVELLRYTGPQTPLRLVTLTDFDGATWLATPSYRPVGAITAPVGLPPGTTRSTVTVDITIAKLEGLWLPSPGDPESVSLPQATVDAETGSLALPQRLTPGLRYRVSGAVDRPGGGVTVASVPTGSDYARLPRLPFAFAEYAQTIVRGASTPFDQAVLIESAVRQDRRLNNRAPPGSSYARLETFLFGQCCESGAQEGTQEQFVTAFAVLARAAGLPTRVVAGLRSGDRASDGTWIVRGRHASAWPEVYFRGEGWVAFDPAPSMSQDVGPGEDLRRGALARVERNQTTARQPAPAPLPVPSSSSPASSTPPAAQAPAGSSPPVGAIVVVILSGLLGALVFSRAWRRLRHRRAGPRGAWSEVLDLLVLLNRRPARWHTADRIAADVAKAVPGAAPHPVFRLAWSADHAKFAPTAAETTTAQVWADLRRLRRAAMRTLPWYRGLLWWADPRPLLRR